MQFENDTYILSEQDRTDLRVGSEYTQWPADGQDHLLRAIEMAERLNGNHDFSSADDTELYTHKYQQEALARRLRAMKVVVSAHVTVSDDEFMRLLDEGL